MKKIILGLTLVLVFTGATFAQDIKIKSPMKAVQTFTQHKEYKERVVNTYFTIFDKSEEYLDNCLKVSSRGLSNEEKMQLNKALKEVKDLKKKIGQARRILKTIEINNSVDYLELFEKTKEVEVMLGIIGDNNE